MGEVQAPCGAPAQPQHLQSPSIPTLGTATKAQEAGLRWFSPSTLEKGPHGSAEGSQGYSACNPAQAQAPSPSLVLPGARVLQHHGLCSLWGWVDSLPTLCQQQQPLQGTYMAHCSFSFLMEPYRACREKSGGSAGEPCQARGLLQGTEEAHQTGSGTLEIKVSPCQVVLVQPCPG